MNNASQDQKTRRGWSYWFFVFLIVASIAYTLGLLILKLTAPADGYSTGMAELSPQGLAIIDVLIARAEGLKVGDVIIAANGRTVEEWLTRAFHLSLDSAERWRQGQTVAYTVLRGDSELVVPIELRRLSPRVVFAKWLAPATSIWLIAAVAIFVFLKKPHERAARAMLVLSLTMMAQANAVDVVGLHLSEIVNRSIFLMFLLAELPGFAVLVGGLLYFALVFPTPKKFAARHSRMTFSLYFLPPLLLLVISLLSGDTWTARLINGTWINNLIALVCASAAIAIGVHSYRTARTATAKSQVLWVVWGGSAPLIIWLALYVIPGLVTGHPLIPTGLSMIPFLITAVAIAFSIIKYRLMDIDTVINRSLVYLTLTTLAGGLYLLLVAAFTRMFQLFGAARAHEGTLFISAILVAVVFSPLRERVQAGIDRAFYRDKLNFRLLLEELSGEISLTIVFSDLVTILTETIPARLNIAHANLLVARGEEDDLISVSDDFRISQNSALAQHLRAERHALIVAPPTSEIETLVAPLAAREIELCLPLIVGNKLVGLYNFGPKRSLEFYSREEIGILSTLGHQAAISIENARLYEQVAEQERLRRDLEIARQIQMGLLPQGNPHVPGFEIFGYSQPALEVGGDFYAYYSLSNDYLGIAVGDVSGKGLPGSLYMAISVSVLESHAASHSQVGPLLEVVNRTLHPRMQAQRMNTALAYVLLNTQKREIQVSNAGLIAPVLLRCEEHETVRYLDPNSLPLGAMANWEYSEAVIKLKSGDALILVSDGIIEAMNEDNELYGFDRFEALIGSCSQNMRAREMVDLVLTDVRSFAGDAKQHDDMTIVVVRVRES